MPQKKKKVGKFPLKYFTVNHFDNEEEIRKIFVISMKHNLKTL